jgi:hypothetical protein
VDRETFLEDPQVVLTGYQVNFTVLKSGLFLFNHLECKTTLTLKAELFVDMYSGPIFTERLKDTEECSEHCLYENNILPCPAKCECAYVRQIVDIINKKYNSESVNP